MPTAPLAPLSVVVLAAGAGARMRSSRPKPLHRMCGLPMVRYVLDAVEELPTSRVVVVVGPDGERISKELRDAKPVTDVVEQASRRGTGDAVLAGLGPLVDHDLTVEGGEGDVLIVPADVPLLRGEVLAALHAVHAASGAAATVLAGVDMARPDMGRVVRSDKDGTVARVVPSRDLVGREHTIEECATGIWCVRRSLLAPALRRLEPDPETGEITLAGIAEVLAATGNRVEAHVDGRAREVVGVNDRRDLAAAERALRERINSSWLGRGVTMVDPFQTYVDATVSLAPDVTLFPGVILQGTTVVGEGTEIGPGCHLIDTRVGPGCRLEHVTAELATVGDDARVGPYAVLAPGAEVAAATVTGAFYTAGADGP
ncbi:MAG: NTP transferase domain-containing protein [Actinobacteria bacterium]|nr:NTP transferase domain-containing protein [Actinomycetota bacterium]NIS37021.1 NTP transferase domain-containing protein [Actinomycetota bacterium]NIT99039.1 NTP transferase domain-containing protein [Actinomycetota bacterium]NIU22655.1 NTP transferase domain-containing protein [Actinomycetota bacterium]NIU71483.1 NTP transferase domain-containing protein [Actinomycetota bacterium]